MKIWRHEQHSWTACRESCFVSYILHDDVGQAYRFTSALLLLRFLEIFCPIWKLSPHSSINTDKLVFGTVAQISCDEGFVFTSGNLVEVIKCITLSDNSQEAVWNVTELSCRRELTAPYFYTLLFLVTLSILDLPVLLVRLLCCQNYHHSMVYWIISHLG